MVPPTDTADKAPKRKKDWSPAKSAELYGVENWGHGYFGVSKTGEVTVRLADDSGKADVSLHEVI